MKRRAAVVAVVVMLVSLIAACGDDDDGDDEAGGGGGEELDVVLSEFVVEPENGSVAAGEVTFVADNQGAEVHELLVVDADSPDELPVDADGAFDEAAFGADKILGEAEDIAPGDQAEVTVDVEPGNYVLLCNLVEMEGGEVESHFAMGMRTTITAE